MRVPSHPTQRMLRSLSCRTRCLPADTCPSATSWPSLHKQTMARASGPITMYTPFTELQLHQGHLPQDPMNHNPQHESQRRGQRGFQHRMGGPALREGPALQLSLLTPPTLRGVAPLTASFKGRDSEAQQD